MKLSLSGHFPPEVGRAMEDEFAILLERLGYRVHRKRDPKSGLDIIAEFHGEPINPQPPNVCKLLQPLFAPEGMTAFSLKRGNFRESDIEELLTKTEKARECRDDEVLRSIKGSVMVTNYTKTEDELDRLLSRNVYCWDSRRLIFYAAKARTCYDLASKGPVKEICIEEQAIKASYLRETGEKIGSGAIGVNLVVLIDDHNKNLLVSYDHIQTILKYIHEKSLKPIVQSTELDVQALFKIHVLGVADKELVESSYINFAREKELHPRVVLTAKPIVFQYGAAPWTALLKL